MKTQRGLINGKVDLEYITLTTTGYKTATLWNNTRHYSNKHGLLNESMHVSMPWTGSASGETTSIFTCITIAMKMKSDHNV